MAQQQGRIANGEDQPRSGQEQRLQSDQRQQQSNQRQQQSDQRQQQQGRLQQQDRDRQPDRRQQQGQDRQRQQDRDRQQYGFQQFDRQQAGSGQRAGSEQFDQQYPQDDRQSHWRDQQRDQDAQAHMQPQGWIRIAVDTNNDGQFDTVENIFMFDLQEAQQRSRQRQQLGQGQFGRDDDRQQMQDRQRGLAGRQDDRQRQQQSEEIRGTVQELRTTWLPQRDNRFVVARVRTRDGRSEQVLLGSREEMRKLDLDRGDQVSVSGRRGQVNDETMLIAREVESDGRTVRPQSEGEDFAQRERQRYTQQDRLQRAQDPATQRYDGRQAYGQYGREEYGQEYEEYGQQYYGQERDRQEQYQGRVAERMRTDRGQQDHDPQAGGRQEPLWGVQQNQERDRHDPDRETGRAQQASAQQDRFQQGRVQQARGQQDRQQQTQQDGTREIRGEVVSTQMMRVPDEEELQLVGDVRMDNGEQMRVHFGPRSKFQEVDLDAGTRVKVKARHGEVGNTDAWVAEEVELEEEDETITVDI